jgi:hypothetical protein
MPRCRYGWASSLSGQRDLQSQEANGGPTSTPIQLVVMQAGTRIDARPGSTRCWICRVSSKSNSSTLGEERTYDGPAALADWLRIIAAIFFFIS